MRKAPKIGQRVRYSHTLDYPGATPRTATGIVTKIWPKRICLNDDELVADDDAMPRYGGLKPESEWQVTMKVDTIPEWWPYRENDKFCPAVAELELED